MPDEPVADLVLASQRLTLRPFTPEDAADVFAAITPALTRFLGWEAPASPAVFAEVWRDWLGADAATEFHFVVRSSQTEELFGLVGLHGIGDAEPELGVWIKESAHGHGYGREAVRAVVTWASQRLAIRMFAYLRIPTKPATNSNRKPAAERNVASRRLAEALNGVVVGSQSRSKFAEVLYRIPAP